MNRNLELLKFIGYLDKDFTKPIQSKPYKVMINPDSLNFKRDNHSLKQENLSNKTEDQKNTIYDVLNFNLIVDCTGIVDAKRTNMSNEVLGLEYVLYSFKENVLKPNFVKIQWGKNTIFKSIPIDFNTTYTLFKPNGDPLRAMITLGFRVLKT